MSPCKVQDLIEWEVKFCWEIYPKRLQYTGKNQQEWDRFGSIKIEEFILLGLWEGWSSVTQVCVFRFFLKCYLPSAHSTTVSQALLVLFLTCFTENQSLIFSFRHHLISFGGCNKVPKVGWLINNKHFSETATQSAVFSL